MFTVPHLCTVFKLREKPCVRENQGFPNLLFAPGTSSPAYDKHWQWRLESSCPRSLVCLNPYHLKSKASAYHFCYYALLIFALLAAKRFPLFGIFTIRHPKLILSEARVIDVRRFFHLFPKWISEQS
ncbi:hypothetical protein PoB_006288000 [Plakobranchus ocellatus]|uniref:Uncharacterized protein n=1 Tax=Plakobranchus ocellatus TaxID=259542 RepID=A0AAV4CWZ1_9GAST|nr:hypothetical protein PoB_006288000 [Plakobranchus ocellatus]